MSREIIEPDFMLRMRDELLQIDMKQHKLNDFLHSEKIETVQNELVILMQVQYQAMATYREALRGRMELMGMFDESD